MTPGEVKNNLEIALGILYRTERDLFARHLHEQTIVARLMMHLQHLLPEWHVDVEFNRQGDDNNNAKEDAEGHDRKPDIIIHRRGPNGPNIAIITAKVEWNRRDNREEAKRICRSIQQRQGYTNAFFVEFLEGRPLVEIL